MIARIGTRHGLNPSLGLLAIAPARSFLRIGIGLPRTPANENASLSWQEALVALADGEG